MPPLHAQDDYPILIDDTRSIAETWTDKVSPQGARMSVPAQAGNTAIDNTRGAEFPDETHAVEEEHPEGSLALVKEHVKLPDETEFVATVGEALRSNVKDGVGVLYADLDKFKLVNDRFGRRTGDLAIIALSQAFGLTLREQDIVGSPRRTQQDVSATPSHLHGDEFAAFFDLLRPEARQREVYAATPGRTNEEKFGNQLAGFTERLAREVPVVFKQEFVHTMAEDALGLLDDPNVVVDDARYEAALLEAQRKVDEIYEALPELGISVGATLYEEGDTPKALIDRAERTMQSQKDERKEAYARKVFEELPRRRRIAASVGRRLLSYSQVSVASGR